MEMKKLLVPFRVEAVFRHNVFRRFLDKGNIRKGVFYANDSDCAGDGFFDGCPRSGHVIFWGRQMTVLGGSLLQILIPVAFVWGGWILWRQFQSIRSYKR
jgi:hypothetical protein